MADKKKITQTPPARSSIWNSQLIVLAKTFQQALQAFDLFQDFQVQQSFQIFIRILRRRNTELGRIQYTNDEEFVYQQKREYVFNIQKMKPRLIQETDSFVPQQLHTSQINKKIWNNTQIQNEELNEKIINIRQSDESALSLKREQMRHEKRRRVLEDYFKVKRRIGPETNDQSTKNQGKKKLDYKQFREQNYSRIASKLNGKTGEISRVIQEEYKKYIDSYMCSP